MIYRSNESGKPVLFARPDQQRSRLAFCIVMTSTCLDHIAAAQSSAASNINQPFIGSIHVLQRPFVVQMKEQSLFYPSELASSVPEQPSEKYRAHTIITALLAKCAKFFFRLSPPPKKGLTWCKAVLLRDARLHLRQHFTKLGPKVPTPQTPETTLLISESDWTGLF